MKNVLLILSLAIFAIACKKEQNKINSNNECSSCILKYYRIDPFGTTYTSILRKNYYDSTKINSESWCNYLQRLDGTNDDLGGKYTVECN